tara:strand:- start:241 stop:525 length:285 start_codon:yes stop_codon:yes gene_type:complete
VLFTIKIKDMKDIFNEENLKTPKEIEEVKKRFEYFESMVFRAEHIAKNESAWMTKMHNLLIEVYNKGQRNGHNKAVEICQNSLKGLENANNSRY